MDRYLFSGIQPSGPLGLGNYVGAMRHWKDLQADHACLFSVVDLHALTVALEPEVLRQTTFELFAQYLACGLDPERHIIFVQSQVAAHTQFAWILQTLTGMGELSRMTQFKDKASRYESNINVGLFAYPTLMAADILLYQTHIVPVGEDQKQHLELARDLAQRFNHRFGPLLVVPEPHIMPVGSRVMSLQDPSKKMSKSDQNQNSFIAILDPPEVIVRKIKRAVTDAEACVCVDSNRPGITNLVNLYAAFSGWSTERVTDAYAGQGYGVFKSDLAELIVTEFQPIQKKFSELIEDKAQLEALMLQGAEKACSIANDTLHRAMQAMGLVI